VSEEERRHAELQAKIQAKLQEAAEAAEAESLAQAGDSRDSANVTSDVTSDVMSDITSKKSQSSSTFTTIRVADLRLLSNGNLTGDADSEVPLDDEDCVADDDYYDSASEAGSLWLRCGPDREKLENWLKI